MLCVCPRRQLLKENVYLVTLLSTADDQFSLCGNYIYLTAVLHATDSVIGDNTITWVQITHTDRPVTWVNNVISLTNNTPEIVWNPLIEGQFTATATILRSLVPTDIISELIFECVLNIGTSKERSLDTKIYFHPISVLHSTGNSGGPVIGLPENPGTNIGENAGVAYIGNIGDRLHLWYVIPGEPVGDVYTTTPVIDIRTPINGTTNLVSITVQANSTGTYNTIQTLTAANTNNWTNAYILASPVPINTPIRLIANYKGYTGYKKDIRYSVITDPSIWISPSLLEGYVGISRKQSTVYLGNGLGIPPITSKTTTLFSLQTNIAESTVLNTANAAYQPPVFTQTTTLYTLATENRAETVVYNSANTLSIYPVFSKITTILGKVII